jgi:microcystin degradation protein MlrC
MRLLIAMMKHETNTFSPVPTLLTRFGHGPGPLYGEAAIDAFRGTGTGLGAYLDLAEREAAEIVLPIAAGASPSGRSRTGLMRTSPTRSAKRLRGAVSTASC